MFFCLFVCNKDYLWFGKPNQLSAIECARRGWICRSNDSIECINCHAQILAQLPSVLQIDQCKYFIPRNFHCFV
jgi:hypothetical protein